MRNDDKHTHARTQALTQTSAWTLARVQFFDPQHFVAKVLSRVGQRGLRYHVAIIALFVIDSLKEAYLKPYGGTK